MVYEEEPYDEGCGLDELEFKDSTLIYRAFFKTSKGCEKEEEKSKYSIQGDLLDNTETKENNRIVELTATKLVIEANEVAESELSTFSAVQPKHDVEEMPGKAYVVFVR